MIRLAISSVAAVFLCVTAQIAGAVDLVNEDDTDQIVMMTENGEETGITISAGESITDVCGSCSLTIGDNEPVTAEGDEIVVVKNGQLTKRSGCFPLGRR